MNITTVENALFVPPQPGPNGRMRMGVFDAEGRFVAASAMVQSNGRLSRPPEPRPAEAELSGTHLYAGLGRAHFGHFLLETATRHWALAEVRAESVLIGPMPGARMPMERGPLRDFHALMAGDVPPRLIRVPTRVARLIVPAQGFGHGALLTGTAAFRAHVLPRLHALGAEGAERLYISRSALRAGKDRVDEEDLIERRMARAGYAIFHPQQHSLAAQCRAYRAASDIVGADGSPFHLVALVARPETRIGIVLRRNRPEMLDRLSGQIAAFTGRAPTCIDAVLPAREQRKLRLHGANGPAALDLDQIFAELEDAGFL